MTKVKSDIFPELKTQEELDLLNHDLEQIKIYTKLAFIAQLFILFIFSVVMTIQLAPMVLDIIYEEQLLREHMLYAQ